jgi:methionine-rich copper-binding protein CopC
MRYVGSLARLLLFLCVASIAHAHALLDHANPRVGSTVAAAPMELLLWFTQKLEPAFSNVEVRDSNGARVDEGRAQVDPSDASLLHVVLKPLPSGTYEVRWRVLSVDTHTTEGRFRFNVGK